MEEVIVRLTENQLQFIRTKTISEGLSYLCEEICGWGKNIQYNQSIEVSEYIYLLLIYSGEINNILSTLEGISVDNRLEPNQVRLKENMTVYYLESAHINSRRDQYNTHIGKF